jgi:hypothetical protein
MDSHESVRGNDTTFIEELSAEKYAGEAIYVFVFITRSNKPYL